MDGCINYDLGGHKLFELKEMGISYDSDINLAKRMRKEECEKHVLTYDNRFPFEKMESKPLVRTAFSLLYVEHC